MPYDIIAFVLAIAAPTVGGLLLLIWLNRDTQRVEERLRAACSQTSATSVISFERANARIETLIDRVTRLENDVTKTSNAHLSTELATLAADVDALAKGVRKNFGKIYAELHQDGVHERNAKKQTDIETPEEVRERLRKEHSLPKLGAFKGNSGE